MYNYYFVYILANKKHGTIYTGVTNNLIRRIMEHKDKVFDGFTKKYNIDKLVYYEYHNSVEYAIQREKQLKRWKREWKIELIEKNNKEWRDLYFDLLN